MQQQPVVVVHLSLFNKKLKKSSLFGGLFYEK
jgi:hypothetical protein